MEGYELLPKKVRDCRATKGNTFDTDCDACKDRCACATGCHEIPTKAHIELVKHLRQCVARGEFD